ncbi:MAG: polyribonucleotide nucleotidyltransferase [Patescibacteria group bacterium]|nr:polyribonucleotide nucleotidyltransferase [Patescibacteria group bacterium]
MKKEIELAGRTLSLEHGRVAERANGAVIAQYGDTMVLVAATIDEPREGISYFPLRVDFVERLYAGGIIKGSRWVKREGRPSDEATVTARMIDRCIRPFFPEGMRHDVQLLILPLSVDQENDAGLLASVGASAALAISDIPWEGPIATTRVGYLENEDEFLLNPTNGQLDQSVMDLIVSATEERVVMLEADAEEVSEKKIKEGIDFARSGQDKIIDLIHEIKSEVGKEKLSLEDLGLEEEEESVKQAKEEVSDYIRENFIEEILEDALVDSDELERYRKILYEEFEGRLTKSDMSNLLSKVLKEAVREDILKNERRLDGRGIKEVRPLEMEIGMLPRTHGSALFKRGSTQALTVATLGSPSLEQIFESMTGEWTKRYIHHYSFPPFSVGETAPLHGPGRREIGHGLLAERALRPVLPPQEEFPYTMRLVSEILSSNGSSSMAATCGSTLALMDAGVPIKTPVAGIAMGLVEGPKGSYKVVTDMAGTEDFFGDMDFKVTGTRDGVTAIQLDVKNAGLTDEIIEDALQGARAARLEILEDMANVIGEPRKSLSEYAPQITSVQIDPKKIGKVIGPGGKTIRKIIEETGAQIDVDDDGTVSITADGLESMESAKEMIENLVEEVEVGKIYEGKVTRVVDFGAFVEILPGQEGLVHVSEMAHRFVKDPHNVLSEGDEVEVKVTEIDDRGRINLSIKALKDRPHRERK